MFRQSSLSDTSHPPTLPTTVDPSGLRIMSLPDRPFRYSHSFPLMHTSSSQPYSQSQSHDYPTESIGRADEVPDDWLDLTYSSSPHPHPHPQPHPHPPTPDPNPSTITVRPVSELLSHSLMTSLLPIPVYPGSYPHRFDYTIEFGRMTPDDQRRVRAETDMMMGLDVQVDNEDEEMGGVHVNDRLFDLANQALTGAEEEGLETPTPKARPFPYHHHHVPPLAPLPSYLPHPRSQTAITIATGATSPSSPDSVDTPIDIQNQRKRRIERERLAKLNQVTPTRPNVQVSETRMLWSTGSSKRSFAELDAIAGVSDGEEGSDDEGDVEGLDPRRKLFSPRLSAELEAQDAKTKEEKKRTITPHRSEDEQDVEDEVLDTPFKSSEYKQTDNEVSDNDDRYTPQKSLPRRAATRKQPTKTRFTRVHPYGTRTRIQTRHRAQASVSESPLVSIEDMVDYTPPSPVPGRGSERRNVKVRDFEAYLAGPKRLREPRFDMKVFHWAMTGCAELVWQGDGVGVKVPDIQKFYKNVLHKEARERKESKGMKCATKDLPGDTSFERQLSGYGFTRSTIGKTMYITRPDLRRDNVRLLAKIEKVWDQMTKAAQLPKVKSELGMGTTLLRKQVKNLESRLTQESQDLEDQRLCLRNLVHRYQIPQADLMVYLSKTQMTMLELQIPIEQGTQGHEGAHHPVSFVRGSSPTGEVDTPLKTVREDDKVEVKPLRRTRRVKNERKC